MQWIFEKNKKIHIDNQILITFFITERRFFMKKTPWLFRLQ
nr:MAG TPA: hypothetical protein [Caudoviricetes sp.]